MKANEIKKGSVFEVDGQIVLVRHVQVQSPSSRSGSTLYKVKGQNIANRQKYERSFKGDEVVTDVDFVRRPVQWLFRDNDGSTFMDSESYEQHVIPDELITEELPYITEGLEGLYAMIADDKVLGIELPPTVVMEIVECSPGIKGASASARTKPATLATGLVVQVPEYLTPGEAIKINTETGEYMSRAN
ncbi:MAG: elongation factor P-like protein YeiP [Gammaproteobacteria bacterium]|nr:elongation factor P-like protein YeiP [Gammaproteobacteria bacterium]